MVNLDCVVIRVDEEFLEILQILEDRIKHAAWEGIDNITPKTLTRVLARKIKASKLLQ